MFVGLAAAAAVLVAMIVSQLQALNILSNGFESGSETSRYRDIINRVDDLDDAYLAVALITGVVFITWMWRAAKNNQALGRERPRLGPGWAIGGWIPPLFLVMPVLIAQDLWRGSDSGVPRGDMRWKIGDRSALVGWWFGLLIGSRVLFVIGNGVADRGGVENVRGGIAIQTVGNAMVIGAAVLGILMVHRLSQRQEVCLRVQNEQWSQRLPPPPPT